MPVGDDRECGGGDFVEVQIKPRKKVKKRPMTNSPYKTRSQHKKQCIQRKPYKAPTSKSEHSQHFLEHDIETDMSGCISETDRSESDGQNSDSPAMSDRSIVNESMHMETPPTLNVQSSLTNMSLSSLSYPASNSGFLEEHSRMNVNRKEV